MNSKVLGFAVLAGVVVAGCTPQTRDEYKQAGGEAAQAMKQDANAAAHAAKSAGSAARKSLDRDSGSSSSATTGSKPVATEGASQISQNVSKALGQAAGLDSSGMTVQASGDDVVLSGTVPSAQQKLRAEEIAKGVCGSTYTVKDKLQVTKG